MAKQFTMDNTEGYTQEQLDELNRRFEEQSAEIYFSETDFIEIQSLAERIQKEFDTENS